MTGVLHDVVHSAFTWLEVLSSYRYRIRVLFCDFGHMFPVCVQMCICA